jgi:hypothetical protein
MFFLRKRSLILRTLFWGLTCLVSVSVLSKQFLKDSPNVVTSQSTIQIGDRLLFLNGSSTHYRFIFSIYKVELYLEKPTGDAETILNSKTIKFARMKFLRTVSAEQIRESWRQEFKANCERSCQLLNTKLDEILNQVPNMKEGDFFEFTYLPDLFLIHKTRLKPIQVASAEFGRIHLSTWLGRHPPSDRFKRQLLGIQ